MANAQLDSLRVTVLVDDCVSYNSSKLVAVHGVSYLLEAKKDDRTYTILVDVGSNHDVLLNNMEALGVIPSAIDAIVLTHCHWDHTRGISKMVKTIGKTQLPVIAHPAIFRNVFVNTPFLRYTGMDTEDRPEQIEACGGKLLLSRQPIIITQGLITTGEVERVTDFEGPGPAYRLEQGNLVADNMPDDISVVANVKEEGLVIVSGCSHAGIVNISLQSRRITNVSKIAAIIGGFHLVNADEEKLSKTVQGLVDIQPGFVSAGHCTGFEAQYALKSAFGERFQPMECGNRYAFGS